jgi:hypothetical protein
MAARTTTARKTMRAMTASYGWRIGATCKQALIELDNSGERLTACWTCNLWEVPDEEWKRLSEEDLRPIDL